MVYSITKIAYLYTYIVLFIDKQIKEVYNQRMKYIL